MLRIGQVESTATSGGQYTDGNVAGGIAATRLRAAAFNAIQEELAHIVESAGITLSPDDSIQVLAALQKHFQANDATLTALAGLATGANKLPYFTGNKAAGQTDLTQVGRDIIGKDSIDAVLQYLKLGEAAKLAVASDQDMKAGIATNLLPSVHAVMSLFSKRSFSLNNYIRIPDVDGGLIIQWGTTTGSKSQTDYRNYPIPFPTGSVFVSCAYSGINNYGFGCSSEQVDGVRFLPYARNSNGALSPSSLLFFAIGY